MKRVFILLILLLLFSTIGCKGNNKEIVETREGLVSAINKANDGDTIYVGDIDFRMAETIHKLITRINLSKSLNFESGYKDRKAILTSGSFIIEGTKVQGKYLSVNFKNITFEGDIDGKSLTDGSWEYSDPNDIEPRMCQYAMLYKGNVHASYESCDFSNYMNENGGAFFALYDDYAGIDSIILNFGDNSNCRLNIDINGCTFNDNYAYYGGGAIYLEGNKENVTLNVCNTTFNRNMTSCMDFAQGGGACFLRDCNSSFTKCVFKENNASYSYGLTRKDTVDLTDVPEEFIEDYLSSIQDQTSGGAISAVLGKLEITDSIIEKNNASLGGGIASYNAKVLVDGTVFNKNTAMNDLLKDESYQTGPWSMMGLGGAVYINSSDGMINEFYNTSFYENTARNGYGSIYSFYNGPNDGGILIYPDVRVYFSTFMNNSEIISYSKDLTEWSARPGNGFEIPHIKYIGCIVSDKISYEYFGKYALPSESNNYTYYGSNESLNNDKITLTIDESTGQIKASSNGEISLNVPKTILPDTYERLNNGKLTIGSNYSVKLYKENERVNIPFAILISVICLTIVCGFLLTVIILKRKNKQTEKIENTEIENTVQSNDEIISRIENEFKITEREKDVLRLLLQGLKRIEIANALFLSESAIKKYTTSLYSKIGVHSKIELLMKYKNK